MSDLLNATSVMDLTRTTRIEVCLVNDYEVVIRGLAAMLEPFASRVKVVECDIGSEPGRSADVALFDTFASRANSLDRAAAMVQAGRVSHVVLYTWDAGEEFLNRAAAVGVSGIISKTESAAGIVEFLEHVMDATPGDLSSLKAWRHRPTSSERAQHGEIAAGRNALSEREREVLALLALGYGNREIGEQLFLSVDTVKTYVRRLYRKLGVNNRTQAAVRAPSYELTRADANLR